MGLKGAVFRREAAALQAAPEICDQLKQRGWGLRGPEPYDLWPGEVAQLVHRQCKGGPLHGIGHPLRTGLALGVHYPRKIER